MNIQNGSEDFKRGYRYAKRLIRQEREEMFKQKLLGVAMIVLAVVSVPACDMDATAAVLFIPAGVYMLFTRKNWMKEASYDN